MNMTKFHQAADPIYQNPIFSFPLTAVDSLILTANTAKRYTIVSNTELLLLNATKDIYVLFGDVTIEAEVPNTDVLTGVSAMLNPGVICGISFIGATHLSIISPYDTVVTLQRWARR